ncbi:hypothetical protein COY07_00830 [Candidatus Peregrinibacteria bacterium CG_4_10_14_0_2_um_filter_43_11]|nr:MAG: hypothetical protein COY07_00830 [Candidatus Peregrinibacteria bacterium CG_4_10_14_0_2_um_filter_43_11]
MKLNIPRRPETQKPEVTFLQQIRNLVGAMMASRCLRVSAMAATTVPLATVAISTPAQATEPTVKDTVRVEYEACIQREKEARRELGKLDKVIDWLQHECFSECEKNHGVAPCTKVRGTIALEKGKKTGKDALEAGKKAVWGMSKLQWIFLTENNQAEWGWFLLSMAILLLKTGQKKWPKELTEITAWSSTVSALKSSAITVVGTRVAIALSMLIIEKSEIEKEWIYGGPALLLAITILAQQRMIFEEIFPAKQGVIRLARRIGGIEEETCAFPPAQEQPKDPATIAGPMAGLIQPQPPAQPPATQPVAAIPIDQLADLIRALHGQPPVTPPAPEPVIPPNPQPTASSQTPDPKPTQTPNTTPKRRSLDW